MKSLRLGKLPPKEDPRTLKLSAYLRPNLPPPPDMLLRSEVQGPWGMMRNDEIGDCAIACPGHAIMSWTARTGKQFTPTDEQIVEAYSAVSGYDPKTGENDNGCYALDVLKYWRRHGIAGHKIHAFAKVDINHPRLIETAIMLFGGLYLGLSLPESAKRQLGHLWSIPNENVENEAPGSWGGHAVWVPELYNPQIVACVTWGGLQPMSWAWLRCYCDEAYAIISPDYLQEGKNPDGFLLEALQRDLDALG